MGLNDGSGRLVVGVHWDPRVSTTRPFLPSFLPPSCPVVFVLKGRSALALCLWVSNSTLFVSLSLVLFLPDSPFLSLIPPLCLSLSQLTSPPRGGGGSMGLGVQLYPHGLQGRGGRFCSLDEVSVGLNPTFP